MNAPRSEKTKLIAVVGAVLINDKNNIVLFQRAANKSFGGQFEFPGGKIETGESEKEALIRELKEELNINVDVEDVLDFKGNSKQLSQIVLTLFIISKWKNKFIIDSTIHSSKKIVNIKNLKKVNNLVENDKHFIKDIEKYFQTNIL